MAKIKIEKKTITKLDKGKPQIGTNTVTPGTLTTTNTRNS